MRHTSRLLGLLLPLLSLLAAPAAAQSTVLMPSAATAAQGNTYDNASWGNYAPVGWTGFRMQFSYAASNFAARGIGSRVVIGAIRFRSGFAGPTTPGAVNLTAGLSCSTGRFPANALDFDYALNHGPDETTVFYGPVTVQSTTQQGVNYVQIVFQTPFSYDPTQGDLLFDISYYYNTLVHVPANSGARYGDAINTGGSLVYGPINSQFATIPYAGVPIVELVYAVPPGTARVETRGTGCGALYASVYEEFHAANRFDLVGASTAATERLSFGPVGGSARLSHTSGSFGVPTATTTLTLADEQCSAPIGLPFAFPYLDKNGVQQTTSQIVVCSDGFVWLDPTQTAFDYSPTAAELCSGAPRVAMYWADLDPSSGGTITHGPSAGGTAYHVTFQGVPLYLSTATVTVQLTLLSDGRIRIDHGPTTVAVAGFCGWSPGRGARVPAPTDLSAAADLWFGFDQLPLQAAAVSRPAFGLDQIVRVDNIAPGTVLGTMCVGLLPAQFDLSGLGMTGCTRWSSWEVTHLLLPNGASSVTWQMTIPNDPGFLGLQLYDQAAMFSPALNQLGIVTSNAVLATVGAW